MLPEILNREVHDMNWVEIDEIRKKIISKEIYIAINQLELLASLNQMTKKHSFRLKTIQNTQIIIFIAGFIFLFINWKVAIVFFVAGYFSGSLLKKKAVNYIVEECEEDRVFLKYALATGLATVDPALYGEQIDPEEEGKRMGSHLTSGGRPNLSNAMWIVRGKK